MNEISKTLSINQSSISSSEKFLTMRAGLDPETKQARLAYVCSDLGFEFWRRHSFDAKLTKIGYWKSTLFCSDGNLSLDRTDQVTRERDLRQQIRQMQFCYHKTIHHRHELISQLSDDEQHTYPNEYNTIGESVEPNTEIVGLSSTQTFLHQLVDQIESLLPLVSNSLSSNTSPEISNSIAFTIAFPLCDVGPSSQTLSNRLRILAALCPTLSNLQECHTHWNTCFHLLARILRNWISDDFISVFNTLWNQTNSPCIARYLDDTATTRLTPDIQSLKEEFLQETRCSSSESWSNNSPYNQRTQHLRLLYTQRIAQIDRIFHRLIQDISEILTTNLPFSLQLILGSLAFHFTPEAAQMYFFSILSDYLLISFVTQPHRWGLGTLALDVRIAQQNRKVLACLLQTMRTSSAENWQIPLQSMLSECAHLLESTCSRVIEQASLGFKEWTKQNRNEIEEQPPLQCIPLKHFFTLYKHIETHCTEWIEDLEIYRISAKPITQFCTCTKDCLLPFRRESSDYDSLHYSALLPVSKAIKASADVLYEMEFLTFLMRLPYESWTTRSFETLYQLYDHLQQSLSMYNVPELITYLLYLRTFPSPTLRLDILTHLVHALETQSHQTGHALRFRLLKQLNQWEWRTTFCQTERDRLFTGWGCHQARHTLQYSHRWKWPIDLLFTSGTTITCTSLDQIVNAFELASAPLSSVKPLILFLCENEPLVELWPYLEACVVTCYAQETSEDQCAATRLSKLRQWITRDHLEIEIDLKPVLSHLKTLFSKTPFTITHQAQQLVQIRQTLVQFLQLQTQMDIGADDFFPVLVYVLIQCAPLNFGTQLERLETAHSLQIWSPAPSLDYCWIQYRAAFEFILNVTPDQLHNLDLTQWHHFMS